MLNVVNALMVRGQNAWYQLREGESGQGLVEYALIIALVSLAAVAALGFLSGKINDIFFKSGNVLNGIEP
jgi:pilus assembly protein Flp/PilA